MILLSEALKALFFPWLVSRILRAAKTSPAHTRILSGIHSIIRPTSLNIGGGPDFAKFGWVNLDAAKTLLNYCPFVFGPACIFPVPAGSIDTSYCSHVLEHLDTDTVRRVLEETRRVLKQGGKLIVKIPDFDLALDAWRRRDSTFFSDSLWDYGSVIPTWEHRGIPDSLEYRAAGLFCGFWNDEYGDHFSRRRRSHKRAYHGPPIVSAEFLRDLFAQSSPSSISACLRHVVITNEPSYHFNHQNAWSRKELESILNSTGFHIITWHKETIIRECHGCPGIDQMRIQSLYCWAERK